MGQNASRGQARAREVVVPLAPQANLAVPTPPPRDARNLSRSGSPAISREHSRDDLIMVSFTLKYELSLRLFPK